MLTRRAFLFGAAALAAIQAVSWTSSRAAAQAPAKRPDQVPGFFRLPVGDVEVTALYDGGGMVRPEILHGLPADRLAALMAESGLDPKAGEPIAINAFLLNTGSRLILVDTGAGTAFGARAGLLPANLRAAGYAPEQVDTVLLTHMHQDHALGLAAPDGKALFPNAVVRASQAEADYWLSDGLPASVPEARKPSLAALRKVADLYSAGGRWKPFGPGEAPVEGVTVEPLPGHTPGHCGFRVTSRGQSLLAFGDIVHSTSVQFAHPEASIDYDVDQARAKATRLALLPKLAGEACWIAGAHLPFPGLGKVRTQGKGFAWLPAPYRATPD